MQAPAGIRAAGNHVREQLESFESAVAEVANHLADDPQVRLAHDDGAHLSAKVRELDDAFEQCRIAPLSLIATVFEQRRDPGAYVNDEPSHLRVEQVYKLFVGAHAPSEKFATAP
jgi:hypothetical protein